MTDGEAYQYSTHLNKVVVVTNSVGERVACAVLDDKPCPKKKEEESKEDGSKEESFDSKLAKWDTTEDNSMVPLAILLIIVWALSMAGGIYWVVNRDICGNGRRDEVVPLPKYSIH